MEYAGNYKLAKQYLLYARALKCIAEGDTQAGSLDYAELYLEQLGSVGAFTEELSERGYAGCGDLLVYVRARKLEQLGSAQEAMDLYAQIPLVLDSMERQIAIKSSGRQAEYDRAMALYNAGQYYEAAQIFKDLNWLDSGSMYNKALSLHVHVFSPATCEAPATCKVCGATEGTALGHSWIAATCTAAKTCSVCGKTEGEALGHDWRGGDCVTPAECARCGEKSTVVSAHAWSKATCTAPKTCAACGKTEGKALGHDWLPATKERPETCSRCGMTRGEKLPAYGVGDIYTFGHYEQDNNMGNGKEPIEWIIIEINTDDSLVLMSRYGLDARSYESGYSDRTWATCTLRSWLNEVFYKAAFDAEEQEKIKSVTLKNENNPQYGTNGGTVSHDKVWLLSINEVTNDFTNGETFDYFTEGNTRVCYPTAYAVAQGAITYDVEGACWWWLRTPGFSSTVASTVYSDGSVVADSMRADYQCIRPVVVVQP